MTGFADVGSFKIYIQDCMLSGFRPLTVYVDSRPLSVLTIEHRPSIPITGWDGGAGDIRDT